MKLVTQRENVLKELKNASEQKCPILCPNAETPEEMEGIMVGAEFFAAEHNLEQVTVGMGFTATYPDHPQLSGISIQSGNAFEELERTARIWLEWLSVYENKKGLFDRVSVIPFLDHGWVPHGADLQLMEQEWFQNALGIIMHDASAYDFDQNLDKTRAYVEKASSRVVVEACADKVYERAELQKKNLTATDLYSVPEKIERFMEFSGVDLIVPNLGTEHRAKSTDELQFQSAIARKIKDRVGSVMALHGTSSLGDRLNTVGNDGICKINYYTAMSRGASQKLFNNWKQSSELTIKDTCGSYIHRTRREYIGQQISHILNILRQK